MKSPSVTLLSLAILLPCCGLAMNHSEWSLSNRERTLRLDLSLNDGRISYSVSHLTGAQATPVVAESPLGIIRHDAAFTNGLSFSSAGKAHKFDERYAMTSGKRRELRNRGVEQSFRFRNSAGNQVEIVCRAYADGVAFAYRFPETNSAPITITGETTGFKLPTGRAWMLPYDPIGVWAPAYESDWQNAIAIGTSAPANKRGWCFPALFQVGNNWIMLSEANIDGTSFATHLEGLATDGLYRIRMPEPEETYGVAPIEATATLPWQSPWRVIIVGNTAGAVAESSLVDHLSAPNEIADTSWIKPGRVSWSWWSDMSSPGDFQKLKSFVDLAAHFGWEYSLVDCGWPDMRGGDVWQLNDYAKSKGVGLILWYNSGGKHSEVRDAGPRDLMHEPATRRAEMAKLQKAGIKGIKVDFMQSDKQYVMQLYRDILRDAAAHQLFVDFHGSTIPRGWARTFPNLLSLEAIAGAEQYWSTNFAEHAHTFHTIYPYTRNVVGSMDYTPVIFGNAKERVPHLTNNPHELATAIAFESGLQHYADSAANYLATPQFVQDFLKTIPVVWDETRFLAGEPGDYTIIARRHGKDWFVAGLNGRTLPRTVKLSLDFLSRGKHQAELIYDASEPRDFARRNFTAKRSEPLTVEMAGRGGFALHLRR